MKLIVCGLIATRFNIVGIYTKSDIFGIATRSGFIGIVGLSIIGTANIFRFTGALCSNVTKQIIDLCVILFNRDMKALIHRR